jgi:metal-responsive CopG/Arc/MetJ family transcriptional regulator
MAVKRDDPGQESITIRVPKDWLDRLDAWREKQAVPPKRGDVIKLAVMQFVKQHNK